MGSLKTILSLASSRLLVVADDQPCILFAAVLGLSMPLFVFLFWVWDFSFFPIAGKKTWGSKVTEEQIADFDK